MQATEADMLAEYRVPIQINVLRHVAKQLEISYARATRIESESTRLVYSGNLYYLIRRHNEDQHHWLVSSDDDYVVTRHKSRLYVWQRLVRDPQGGDTIHLIFGPFDPEEGGGGND